MYRTVKGGSELRVKYYQLAGLVPSYGGLEMGYLLYSQPSQNEQTEGHRTGEQSSEEVAELSEEGEGTSHEGSRTGHEGKEQLRCQGECAGGVSDLLYKLLPSFHITTHLLGWGNISRPSFYNFLHFLCPTVGDSSAPCIQEAGVRDYLQYSYNLPLSPL